MMNYCILILAGRVLATVLATVLCQDIARTLNWGLDMEALATEVRLTEAEGQCMAEVQVRLTEAEGQCTAEVQVQLTEAEGATLLPNRQCTLQHRMPASLAPIREVRLGTESLSPDPHMGFQCQQVPRMEVAYSVLRMGLERSVLRMGVVACSVLRMEVEA